MIIKNKFNGYSRDGSRLYPGGDSPSSAPTSQNITQTTIPDYARPYVENMLGKNAALIDQPYQTYKGNRIAGFDPMQLQAQQAAANLGPSKQLGTATQMAGLAGLNAGKTKYNATSFGNQFNAPKAFAGTKFGNEFNAPKEYAGTNFTNQFQTPKAYKNTQFTYEKVNPFTQLGGTMEGAQTDYAPELTEYQMGPVDDVTTESFAQPGSAEAYMSPYMQSVVGIQQREAQRAADIAGTQLGGQAAQQGAFGGSRHAIMQAEAARNLAQQKGDIQAQGSQAAYQQAQQQFNAEQAASLQAQQANQQAGLTVGQQNLAASLGVQQLGAGQIGLQTALANMSNDQQANVQNLAAKLQTQGLNAQQAMQAALANQQAGLSTQQMAEQSKQYGYGQQMTAAQQRAQYGLAAQQAGEQSKQFGAGLGMTAAQQKAQYGLAGKQAGEQSKQFGYGQGMTAAQQKAQYGLAGQQASEQSKQFGANLGLQGIQQQLAAAGTLGQLGQTQFGQQKDIINAQANAGAQRQAQQQQKLTQDYADFQRQQQYPYQQLSYMSDMLRGLPMSQSTQSIYAAPPSALSQLGGAALVGKGAGLFKKGGAVKASKKSAGLAALALKRMG